MSKASIAYTIEGPGVRTTFAIGSVPGRKQRCLYIIENTDLSTLAFFRTPDDAAKAVVWLERLVESAAATGIHSDVDTAADQPEDAVK